MKAWLERNMFQLLGTLVSITAYHCIGLMDDASTAGQLVIRGGIALVMLVAFVVAGELWRIVMRFMSWRQNVLMGCMQYEIVQELYGRGDAVDHAWIVMRAIINDGQQETTWTPSERSKLN